MVGKFALEVGELLYAGRCAVTGVCEIGSRYRVFSVVDVTESSLHYAVTSHSWALLGKCALGGHRHIEDSKLVDSHMDQYYFNKIVCVLMPCSL